MHCTNVITFTDCLYGTLLCKLFVFAADYMDSSRSWLFTGCSHVRGLVIDLLGSATRPRFMPHSPVLVSGECCFAAAADTMNHGLQAIGSAPPAERSKQPSEPLHAAGCWECLLFQARLHWIMYAGVLLPAKLFTSSATNSR